MSDLSAITPPAMPSGLAARGAPSQGGTDPLYLAAQKLEAQFLAQMLSAAGFGQARESFGGGEGESQFTSFLVTEYADAMAEKGGIGLAEMIFERLKVEHDQAGI